MYPNPNRPAHLFLKMYESAGHLVGKCLYESSLEGAYKQLVQARFTHSFLAQIIVLCMCYKCLETDDPEFYKSKVCFILNNDMSEIEPVFAEEKFSKYGQLDKVREDSLRDPLQEQQGVEYSKEKGMAPTPVLLPGESQGRRSLVGCHPRGQTESDTTEQLSTALLLMLSHFSRVGLCETPWTVTHQAPLSLGILQMRILEWASMPSSRGIFPTQRSNPGLLYCRQILYFLNHQGSPRMLEWVAYSFSRGTCQPSNQTGVSCFAARFLTSWATQEHPI